MGPGVLPPTGCDAVAVHDQRRQHMRLEPLYRVRFIYPEDWEITLTGELGSEEQHLFFAEGHTEGRISGRFRASNFPRRRTDKTFTPNFHGVIQTDDGATIL